MNGVKPRFWARVLRPSAWVAVMTALAWSLAYGEEPVAKHPGALNEQAPVGLDSSIPGSSSAKSQLEQWRVELARLADANAPVSESAVSGWLDRLLAGQVPRELVLEVLEAAERCQQAETAEKLKRYNASLPTGNDPAKYGELLYGGDISKGRKIFFEKPEANCAKCHKAEEQGGEIGPPLLGGTTNLARAFVLESLFWPDAHTTPGYETVSVLTKNRMGYNGILKRETEVELAIETPDDGMVTVQKADVAARRKGLSLMPDGLGQSLPRRDLRDLIEYLATLKPEKATADMAAEPSSGMAASTSREVGF